MLYDCAEIPMLQLKDQNISYEKERDRNTNVLGKEKGVLESENVKYFGTKSECYKKHQLFWDGGSAQHALILYSLYSKLQFTLTFFWSQISLDDKVFRKIQQHLQVQINTPLKHIYRKFN